jgi:hypothetical protein
VTPEGDVTTVAQLTEPEDPSKRPNLKFVAPAPDGTLYASAMTQIDSVGITPAIYRVLPGSHDLQLYAGRFGDNGYRDGLLPEARFNFVNDLIVDKAGNLYVADTFNDVIRKIEP